MEMEQVKVVGKPGGEVWLYQDDGTEHGAGIKLHADQIPLLCRGLMDVAGCDESDIPRKRQAIEDEFAAYAPK